MRVCVCVCGAHRVVEHARHVLHGLAVAARTLCSTGLVKYWSTSSSLHSYLAKADLAVGQVGHLRNGRGKVERGLLPPLGIDAVEDERDAATIVRHVATQGDDAYETSHKPAQAHKLTNSHAARPHNARALF